MFDANAAYIKKGRKFFVDIYSVSDRLKAKGINKGDLILCHMLNDDNENPCVDMMVNGKTITVCGGDDYCDNWFVYAGSEDLTDFICKVTKNRAKQYLINNAMEK
tara:strand:+ start:3165 stop:3479 length:315 start_codon:yes stop_codon:yes gene_type:complete